MILIAPTAFKGTLGAAEAARALEAGARRALPRARLRVLPLSDGGPGLIDALHAAAGGTVAFVTVAGPLGEPARGRILRVGDDAVVESADACGLHLVPRARRDPLAASSYGVGELIGAAAQGPAPPRRIVLGLGGSATVDGGAGMARALGWRLLDEAGAPIPDGGAGLLRLARLLPPEAPRALPPVTALADVQSPLLGELGAAAVFGPQKGADVAGVRRLERALTVLAERVRAQLGRDVRPLAGGGAAGGLGAGAVAFLDARLVSGSDWVLDRLDFDAALGGAELLVTGEGSYDAQSGMGKIVGAVIARARRRGVPVLLVAGRIETVPPPGVRGVDGGGAPLDAAALARLAAEHVPRLLSAEGSG
ncbi:MAG: glycerate kinase [Gemmatimonadetes bacterium]|nr:glycerate kinase [Gemmatimonadota bacterium]